MDGITGVVEQVDTTFWCRSRVRAARAIELALSDVFWSCKDSLKESSSNTRKAASRPRWRRRRDFAARIGHDARAAVQRRAVHVLVEEGRAKCGG